MYAKISNTIPKMEMFKFVRVYIKPACDCVSQGIILKLKNRLHMTIKLLYLKWISRSFSTSFVMPTHFKMF